MFCVPQSVKTKETNPTRPGSPTPCKQALILKQKLADNAKSQRRAWYMYRVKTYIINYGKKHNAQYKNKYVNSCSAKLQNCFSLNLRTSPSRKRSVSFFSVGLLRTVCAFVSLKHNNILQQYINTIIETASPNFIQTASSCSFEKFRIKGNPNRPSL